MKVGCNKIGFPTLTFPPTVKSYPMHCNALRYTLHYRSNHEISPPNLRSGVGSIPHFGTLLSQTFLTKDLSPTFKSSASDGPNSNDLSKEGTISRATNQKENPETLFDWSDLFT